MAFMTSKAANEKISTLEARVEELETDAKTKDEKVTELEQTVADRDATIAEHTANAEKITELETTITEITGERDTAQSNLTAKEKELKESNEKLESFDTEVEKAAQAKFQSLGGNPIEGGDDRENETELTGLARATAAHKARKK